MTPLSPIPFFIYRSLVISASALLCTAAFSQTSVITDGSNAATLTKITIDGVEHTSFIGATVIQFSMYGDNGRTTQLYADGSSALVGQAAPTALEDSSLLSGYTALRSLGFDFDSAVVNRPGADIFLFEVGATETSYLTLNITINGTTINYGSNGNPFIDSGETGTHRLSEGPYQDTATTLEELIAIPAFTTFGSISTKEINYLAIDLSDFGIADGASITSISLAGTTVGDGQYDISGIVGLGSSTEEPSISIETDGGSAANLTKITIDDVEYTWFIGATVTQFSMYGNNGRTIQFYPQGSSALLGGSAPSAVEDSSLTTGYGALRSLEFDFNSEVVNQAGADIFLFEISPTETSNLTLNITINGTTINYGSSGNPFVNSGNSGTYRLAQSPHLDTATSLTELQAIPDFTTFGSITTNPIGYLAIDLSDFGIADGASITNIHITGATTGDGQYDISGIVAIPENPSSPPLNTLAVLSGNTFSSTEDYQFYGDLDNYSSPRSGVSYSFLDPVNTGGHEVTHDPYKIKLTSGKLASIDPNDMLYLGNTSGLTIISTVFDLGVECEVESVDTWVLCGAGTQTKKVTSYVSADGVTYTHMGNSIIDYPTEDTIMLANQSVTTPLTGRYVKTTIEEKSLDYLDNWSYTSSIGEIVIVGQAPDPTSPIQLLSNNYLRESGAYNTSMLKISTGATYSWLTTQPFVTGSELITSDEDDSSDGVSGYPDLTDGSDTQTDASMVTSSSTSYQDQYATVQFDLKDIYDIAEIDVWTMADSTRYMDGYEVQISTNNVTYTSLGYTVNKNSRTSGSMVNAWTGEITGKNARYVKIIMHNASDSEQLVVGEIAIWGSRPYNTTLPSNATPDKVVVKTKLKNYSKLYLDWTDYNHVVNDVYKYKLYIETEPFSDVSGKTEVQTITTGSTAQIAKASSYFSLEPETTYYIAITPVTSSDVERQDVTPQVLTTPGVIDTTGKIGNMFCINDPAYGAGDYEDHDDEWTNMLRKAELLREIGGIQKNRWSNHDGPVMDQYSRRGITFHLFYNDPTKLSFDMGYGVWSFSTYNEPDLSNANVVTATNTIKANHDALKATDSRLMLFEPALGDTNTSGFTWLESFYNADGQNGDLVRTYFDVMDVHAYCKHADPYPSGLLPGVPEALIDKIDDLRTLMASHGDEDKPIVFTELGWSTYTGGGSYLRGIDDVTQRNYLARAFMISAAKDIKAIFWHNFQDNGTDGTSIEHNFGIIDWDGAPKPAYYGYYILSRVLSDAVFDIELSNVSHPNYGYRFWDDNQGVYITTLWAADETTRTATLATSEVGVRVVGIDGSLEYVETSNSSVNVAISGAPVFIYSETPLSVTTIN